MSNMLLMAFLLASGGVVEAQGVGDVRIVGETKYKPHSLVRLKAEGLPAKAAVLWRVTPPKVDRATTAPHLCEFTGHPGEYTVELLVIRVNEDGVPEVAETRSIVEIDGCNPVPPSPIPPSPPTPPKPDGGAGKLDPPNALGRIQFGNAGCTATVIGPRRPDGKWDVLTAAHCVRNTPKNGKMRLLDGRTIGVTVVSVHAEPDVCWLVTDDPIESLPYANLAASNPEVGTKIWHAGYGVDTPGNREDGHVAENENGQGQIRFILSVSSGDSGGGILRTDTNEVVSTVCCTSVMARKASMWGGSTEAIRKTRPVAPKVRTDFKWEPVPMPIKLTLPRAIIVEE